MFEKIKKYILTIIELQKLSAIEKTALIIGTFVSGTIVMIFSLVAIMFLSIGFCLYISALMGNNYAGFFIVGSFYVLCAIVAFFIKDNAITKPVINGVIKLIFNKDK